MNGHRVIRDGVESWVEDCGAVLDPHPTMPHLVGVCARPKGHDGEHSNVLAKAGAPR